MDETLINYLKKLELSESEAKLYLIILLYNGKTIRELAQILEINRSTAFVNTERLIEKELVMKVVKDSKTLIIPNEPKLILKNLVNKQIKSTKTIQQQLPNMANELQKKYSPFEGFNDAEIKHYKGKLGIKRIYDDALKSNELRICINCESGMTFPDIEKKFFQIFDASPNFTMYMLFADSPFARQYPLFHKERYFHKFIPPHIKVSRANTLIYDKKISLINYNNLTGTILQNTDYYTNIKSMFDFMWQVLPENT